jgi:hypothetical protein
MIQISLHLHLQVPKFIILKGHPEPKVLKVLKDILVIQVITEEEDPKELKVIKDLKVIKGLKDIKAHKVDKVL